MILFTLKFLLKLDMMKFPNIFFYFYAKFFSGNQLGSQQLLYVCFSSDVLLTLLLLDNLLSIVHLIKTYCPVNKFSKY